MNPWPTPNSRRDNVRHRTRYCDVFRERLLLIAVHRPLDPVKRTKLSESVAKGNSERFRFLRLFSMLGYQTQPPGIRQPKLWHGKPRPMASERKHQSTEVSPSSDSNSSSKAPDVLYANRIIGIDNPTGIADVNGPSQVAQFVAPQALVCIDVLGSYYTMHSVNVELQWNQGNTGDAPVHLAAGPFQAQTNVDIDQTLAPDMTVTESLRRLAGRYVDNPESLVNEVRLEPGPSGRFLVIIMLETADIL